MKGAAKLIARVENAAEAALAADGHVAPVEVMLRLGWLVRAHLEAWRFGNANALRAAMPVKEENVAAALDALASWAAKKSLVAVEAVYTAKTRDARPLRFTSDGDERPWRTHFAPASLGEKKIAKLKEKLEKKPDLVVVDAAGMAWTCASCGADGGDLYVREAADNICLACADLDHLVFLPSGDAALSRRAKAQSKLCAVVMRFRRSVKRWERQGILAEEDAIANAEAQCLGDAAARAARAVRAEEKRKVSDVHFANDFTERVRRLFPACPADEAEAIARHASERGSGRVGRSAAGRALDDGAVTLAVVASIRHRHTSYDELLMRGVARREARDRIRDNVDAVLARWRASSESR